MKLLVVILEWKKLFFIGLVGVFVIGNLFLFFNLMLVVEIKNLIVI